MTIEARIANANAAPSSTVNSVVWVMNPGPTALVAIRNIAPSRAVLAGSDGFGAVSTDGFSGGPSGVAMRRILTVAGTGLSRSDVLPMVDRRYCAAVTPAIQIVQHSRYSHVP